MTRIIAFICTLIISISTAATALAAPGDLDTVVPRQRDSDNNDTGLHLRRVSGRCRSA